MAFQGLLRALDGRQDDFRAMHIWQWEMTGSQGSTWNINPSASANQPDNRPLAQWLSGFVSNLLPGDYNDDAIVDAADYVVWRKAQGQTGDILQRCRWRRQRPGERGRLQPVAEPLRQPAGDGRGSRIGAGTGHDLDDARRTVCRISPPPGAFRTAFSGRTCAACLPRRRPLHPLRPPAIPRGDTSPFPVALLYWTDCQAGGHLVPLLGTRSHSSIYQRDLVTGACHVRPIHHPARRRSIAAYVSQDHLRTGRRSGAGRERSNRAIRPRVRQR